MYKRQLILLLCLLFLGGSLSASKTAGGHGLRSSKRGGSGGFHRSNYMSGDPNRHPPDGDFYIDEAQGRDPPTTQSATYEGSADQDDEDTGASGTDDEDDENETEGSAVMPHETHCLKMRIDLERDGISGHNIPRCTETGEYEVVQCSRKTGECWCVNYHGEEIPNTSARKPENPDCTHVDRNKKIVGETPVRRPGINQPKSEPTHSTETGNGFVIEQPRGKETSEPKNDKETETGLVEIKTIAPETDPDFQESQRTNIQRTALVAQPGILAGIIGGAVVGLLCAVLLVMFIVYRMRKKDEGSYALDEPKRSPSLTYTKARDKEFFA